MRGISFQDRATRSTREKFMELLTWKDANIVQNRRINQLQQLLCAFLRWLSWLGSATVRLICDYISALTLRVELNRARLMTGGGYRFFASANFGELILGCINTGFCTHFFPPTVFEIYKICNPLQRSTLKDFRKFRQHYRWVWRILGNFANSC